VLQPVHVGTHEAVGTRSKGRVMRRNRYQALAPSMRAAAYSCGEMPLRPAIRRIIANALSRQTALATRAAMAPLGSARMLASPRPNGASMSGMTPPSREKIHLSSSEPTSIAMVYGTSTTARTNTFHRVSRSSHRARAKPTPSVIASENTVKRNVASRLSRTIGESMTRT